MLTLLIIWGGASPVVAFVTARAMYLGGRDHLPRVPDDVSSLIDAPAS